MENWEGLSRLWIRRNDDIKMSKLSPKQFNVKLNAILFTVEILLIEL